MSAISDKLKSAVQSVFDLPKENNNQRNVTVKSIVFTVSRSGNITIGKNVFDLNSANFLEGYIKQISTAKPQPEIHIRADKEILFENLGRLLKLLQNSGIERIAFLSEPISESYWKGLWWKII